MYIILGALLIMFNDLNLCSKATSFSWLRHQILSKRKTSSNKISKPVALAVSQLVLQKLIYEFMKYELFAEKNTNKTQKNKFVEQATPAADHIDKFHKHTSLYLSLSKTVFSYNLKNFKKQCVLAVSLDRKDILR